MESKNIQEDLLNIRKMLEKRSSFILLSGTDIFFVERNCKNSVTKK